jgi:hypothetical protein
MGAVVETATQIVTKAKGTKLFSFFGNPLVSLGATLFLSWVLRPKVPDIEDFGTSAFDDFEK